ncbi:OmpP1/FadL family transporter [Flavobacterium faecale]|uniref:OmpP1/FadL family transporter n=1 Tax=Flavobacterium faecale TaxID=1355330 RepID=UPI003AAE7CAE
MKKSLIILITGLTFGLAQAQESVDAIRYSQDNLTGTARYRAMSGAFGALGGDLSSLNSNPAGSAVFSNNQMGFTLSNFDTKNESNYYNTNYIEKNDKIKLNQGGVVFVFHNQNPKNDWKKFSLAINYENTNNFDNSIVSVGTNPTRSIGDYFLHYANGVTLNTLENGNYRNLLHGEQQAYLGYQAYMINPVSTSPNNTQYNSNVAAGGNYYQENSVYSTGYNGKLSFNAATSYKNKLYLGINLNTHFLDYRQSSLFYEDNNNNLNNDYRVTQAEFSNELYSYGSGFSFQLGAIAKITNEVRLGLTYESPTWYNIYDEFSQKLIAVSSNSSGNLPADVVNPNATNIYDPYKLQTPSKVTGSFAYVFGKKGLFSIDYALKDYSSTKFKPENDPYFSGLNSFMTNTFSSTQELRIGGEYKIEALSLRAGYRFEESPYKNNSTIGDLKGYSAGIGYNFGNTKLDLSYATSQRNSQQGFFTQGFTDSAKINTKIDTITLTLLFEL